MADIHFSTIEEIRIGSIRPLDEKQLSDLVRLFNRPLPATGSVLGGRASVARCTIEDVGPVIIKFYRRGGLIRRFVEKTYLRTGKTRGQREYEMLARVRQIGVLAPRPVAFAHRGLLFYQCWLVTGEVEGHRTLAELSLTDPNRAAVLTTDVAAAIKRLIAHQLHHVDLHPGNVLIDPQLQVYLIDFDKARRTRLNAANLQRRYFQRWQRAVRKHRLPEALTEALASALFQ